MVLTISILYLDVNSIRPLEENTPVLTLKKAAVLITISSHFNQESQLNSSRPLRLVNISK